MGRAKEFDTESVLRKATAVFDAYIYEGTSLTLLLNELGFLSGICNEGNHRRVFIKLLEANSAE